MRERVTLAPPQEMASPTGLQWAGGATPPPEFERGGEAWRRWLRSGARVPWMESGSAFAGAAAAAALLPSLELLLCPKTVHVVFPRCSPPPLVRLGCPSTAWAGPPLSGPAGSWHVRGSPRFSPGQHLQVGLAQDPPPPLSPRNLGDLVPVDGGDA